MNSIQKAKLALFLGLVLIINACGGSKRINYSNPKNITLNFYRALGANDFERASLMATNQTKSVLSLLQNLFDLMPSSEQEKNNEEVQNLLKTIKKAKCEVDGDNAKCYICCQGDQKSFDTEPLVLKKQNKQWLVDMSKEDLMPNSK